MDADLLGAEILMAPDPSMTLEPAPSTIPLAPHDRLSIRPLYRLDLGGCVAGSGVLT
ncbi:hypothetical protein [Methylobacterium tarhaniae]|uniref:hypothetical protein n=1 Tax=Methylobacterium tarhaniae TaxID=1187852 RepID=UPI0012ECEF44|nr:hypothetical protein [Methylobacterium tarhaniae]